MMWAAITFASLFLITVLTIYIKRKKFKERSVEEEVLELERDAQKRKDDAVSDISDDDLLSVVERILKRKLR